jgi:CheY-like chemotaxis protein
MAKILVAEDERDIRDLITFTLNYAGHQVVAVANGEEAVEAALHEMPDMILMDVRMPKMTGYEACQKIKSNKEIQHIPIDAGATEYLLKPFAPMELTARVNELLAKIGK